MAPGPAQSPDAWHTWEVPLLGFRTRFESDDPGVIAVARRALGAWSAAAGLVDGEQAPAVVRIGVGPEHGGEAPSGRVSLDYRVSGSTLTISGDGVHAAADWQERRAEARVAPGVVADEEHFRYGVLESLALFMASYRDRQPLHAAAVCRGEAVILLVGPAGVGKSTLTYAALRAGFAVFAEDIVWLQVRPAVRLWGLASRIHLPADAGDRFPELRDRAPVLVAAGEPKIVVPIGAENRPAHPRTDAAGVCLIERAEGAAARLETVSRDEVCAHLAPTEPGFVLFADTIAPALDVLAAPGGWRLTLSSRPADAIPLLARVAAAIGDRRP